MVVRHFPDAFKRNLFINKITKNMKKLIDFCNNFERKLEESPIFMLSAAFCGIIILWAAAWFIYLVHTA